MSDTPGLASRGCLRLNREPSILHPRVYRGHTVPTTREGALSGKGITLHDATSWALAQKTGSSSAKFILLRLADYAGTDWSCYPSARKLAQECEMGESTVRQATKLLAELGLIRVFYRYRPDGSQRSCRYQLLPDGPDTMEPDADDWADRRQNLDAMRQQPAGGGPESGGEPRQDLALIPSTDPSPVDPSPVTPRAPRSERGTRVPRDFQPDEGMRAWFVAEQLASVIDGRIEHQKFMNYWLAKPGRDGRKVDWRRTWMNWMLEAAQRAGRRPAAVPLRSTTDEKVAATLALAERFRQEEAG